MTPTASAVVVGSIHRHRVVVPASRVATIGDHRDAASEDAIVVDVAALLGVSPPPGPRRALRLHAHGAPRWLIFGERVSVTSVPTDAFAHLPEWLAGTSGLLPFARLVALDGAFAFELDLARVLPAEVA